MTYPAIREAVRPRPSRARGWGKSRLYLSGLKRSPRVLAKFIGANRNGTECARGDGAGAGDCPVDRLGDDRG